MIDAAIGFGFGVLVTACVYFAPSPFAVRGVKPRLPRLPRRSEPGEPVGAPVPVGHGRSPIGDGTPPTMAELDAMFGAGNPVSEAMRLNEMAQARGLVREPEGDPPGTYRPGETEGVAWLSPPR